MNLKLILPLKRIKLPISQKEVSIPKMGLKHYNLLKDVKGPDENLKILTDSICPNLEPAEVDFVSLHLLEFNGKIKSTKTIQGYEYNLQDVYVCQRLEFQYHGKTFTFRAPDKFELFSTVDDMLSKCLLHINGEVQEVNFLEMPAFVLKWANDISTTLAIPGPNGPIKGISELIGLFE